MTFPEFDQLVETMFMEEAKIGDTKGKEYTQGDRLDNFKRLAKELNLTPEQVLWVYLKKHLDSIAAFIRNGCPASGISEPIEGRITDARVYLALLRALIEERNPRRCQGCGKVTPEHLRGCPYEGQPIKYAV